MTIWFALLLFVPFLPGKLSELELPILGGSAKIKFKEINAQIEEHTRKLEEVSNKAEIAINSIAALHVAPKLLEDRYYQDQADDRLEREGTLIIGCSEFTEQRLLCAIVTILLRKRVPHLKVIPKYNYGGPALNFLALLRGQMDVYAVYTWTGFEMSIGSSLTYIRPSLFGLDEKQSIDRLNEIYEKCPEPLTWLEPLGLINNWELVMLKEEAEKRGINKLSDLKKHSSDLRLGCEHEFFSREAGYGALNLPDPHGYELQFEEVRFYRHNEVYDALLHGEVDVIDGFSTDPYIENPLFKRLDDDKQLLGEYLTAPVMRSRLLQKHGAIADALRDLKGKITYDDMKGMICRADRVSNGHLDEVERIAFDFLVKKGLLEVVAPKRKRV